jgi:hypothetical protein
MAALRVVPALDEVEDGHPGLGLGAEAVAVEQLALERREEALAQGIVVAVAYRAHRRPHTRLLTAEALGRAEAECLEDAEARALRREREAARRARLDEESVPEFARQLKERNPRCPQGEEQIIAARACRKYSGRSGRTAAAKAFDPEAIDLAVIAHVRHAHTDYDTLLCERRLLLRASRKLSYPPAERYQPRTPFETVRPRAPGTAFGRYTSP